MHGLRRPMDLRHFGQCSISLWHHLPRRLCQVEGIMKPCSCGGQVGVDGTRSGWLADDGRRLEAFAGAAAIDWRTADCGPGDVVVLGELCDLVRPLKTAGMTVCGVMAAVSCASHTGLDEPSTPVTAPCFYIIKMTLVCHKSDAAMGFLCRSGRAAHVGVEHDRLGTLVV